MSRFDTAYLDVEDDTSTATFEFSIGLNTNGDLDKNYLMGSRGQYIQEIWDQSDALGEIDALAERRAGFWIDGGAGNYSETVEFEAGMEAESIQWGDGTGGEGQDNVTPRDASGPGVKPLTRYHVMSLWLSRTLTDSRNPARFYFGEWTDGSKSGHSESGAFNQPFPCAVTNLQPNLPDAGESTAYFEGTLELSLLVPFGDYEPPSWMADSNVGTFLEHVGEQLGVIPDE